MTIIVAHVKHPPKGYECIRCDRASVLGNPYEFKHETYREASIKAYREWLWENYVAYACAMESSIADICNEIKLWISDEFPNKRKTDPAVKAKRKKLFDSYFTGGFPVVTGLVDELDYDSISPEDDLIGLGISSKFKAPSIYQVIAELQMIAKVANTKNVALLCWCRGHPSYPDKACHCDRIKSCIEKLFL